MRQMVHGLVGKVPRTRYRLTGNVRWLQTALSPLNAVRCQRDEIDH
jgi:hypothetical protein